MNDSNESNDTKTNTIALLSLPYNVSISLDGSGGKKIRKTDGEDLIVIHHVPDGFHLLTTMMNSDDNDRSGGAMHSVGLLILFNGNGDDSNNFVGRKFDHRTEELSPEPLDEVTKNNLVKAIENKNVDLTRVIPHVQFVASSLANVHDRGQNQNQVDQTWRTHLTNFITGRVLNKHHLTGNGDKIIPGSYTCEEDDGNDFMNTKPNSQDCGDQLEKKGKVSSSNSTKIVEEDGTTMQYPPIPCLLIPDRKDDKKGGKTKARIYHGLVQHHIGTRRYLAMLEPNQRTVLFTSIGPNGDVDDDDTFKSLSPPDIVFNDILHRYYDDQWEILLGDLQLSFAVFICCSCLSSLEHW